MVSTESLKDKTSKPRMNWAELVFLAEAEREWFEEVTVITLKAHYQSKVYNLAWDQAESPEELDDVAKVIMDSGQLTVQEFIKIDENSNVEICLDREEITDDVVEEALDLLTEISITPNARLVFGEPKTFLFKDMERVFDKRS